ncbi:MAG: PKD domain-containing protein [Thermoplasmata archaeon]|nr:PKD domain-containing protein [Thermoplasmata archaeon]
MGPRSSSLRTAGAAALLGCLLAAGFTPALSHGVPTTLPPAGVALHGAGSPSAKHFSSISTGYPLRGRPLVASATPLSWWNISSESATPFPIAWFTEGTWDASDGYLMFYGGDNFAGTNLANTWTYSGGSWQEPTTTGSPGPLDGPALAYDAASAEVVMYGGLSSYSPFSYTNLTWLYSAGNWTSSHLNPTPPPRLAGSMVYDPDLGGVVLFGGYNNSDPSGASLLNDLWLYKEGAWSRVAATNAPPVRTWASIAYDPTLHELVLYSGVNAAFNCIGDTWTFANGTWTHRMVPAGGPSDLCATSLVFDPDAGRVILTGGANLTTNVASTASWSFNGSAWVALNASGVPGPHEYAIAAWDPTEHALVVAGGWPYAGSTDILSVPLAVTNFSGPASIDVGQTADFQATVIGGVPQQTYNWTWGDGTQSSGGTGAQHTYATAGPYTVTLQVTDVASNKAQANFTIQVVSGLTASIAPSSALSDVGLPIDFTGTASGGSGGTSYAWTFGDGTGATGANPIHAYAVIGNYSVTLSVTDSNGGSAMSGATVSVYAPLRVSFVGVPSVEVGVPVQLTPSVNGGAPPLTYAWASDDGGSATTASDDHTFATAGPHSVTLTVQDGAGASAIAEIPLTVLPRLAVTILGPSTASAGTSYSWTINVSGGDPPYQESWTLPGGITATGRSANFTFAGSGQLALLAIVTDALGAVTPATQNVTVSAGASSSGSPVGGIPTLDLLGVGIAALLVVGIGVAWWWKRSPRSPP